MKKIFALLTAPLLLAGLLFSCKPEQSELNMDALPGSATVTGTVEYIPGVTKVGEAFVTNYKQPAAGRTVSVKVYTESYLSDRGTTSGSYRTFTATTDKDGHYSISVPVGYSAISAEVMAVSFIGEKTALNAENQIITLSNAVFESQPKRISLEDQDIVECPFVMTSSKEPEVEYNQKVTLNGLVEVASESRGESSLSKVYNAYSCNLLVKVYINDNETLTYDVTANSNGSYTLDMMLPNNCWEKRVEIAVIKEESMAEFTHYYKQNDQWYPQVINTIYAGYRSMYLSSSHKVAPMNMETLQIIPQPANPSEVKGIGNAGDNENGIENHNPMYWNR